jgi:hypothetical protein
MKVVLPVTIIRDSCGEKQSAHTLDITSDSARLGGLHLPIEPGELIELQRGAMRGKFYVFWVGAPNTMLAGQAGIRGLAPKPIWGVDLPDDIPDPALDMKQVRTGLPLVRTAHASSDLPWPTRRACQGGAVARVAGVNFPLYAQISDLSPSGVYLETPISLSPNTQVDVRMNVEGVILEMPGVVKSCDPSIGMDISFQKSTPDKHNKLLLALQYLQSKALQTVTVAAQGPQRRLSI